MTASDLHAAADGRARRRPEGIPDRRLCTKRSARGQGHTTRLLLRLWPKWQYPCRINAQTYLADMYASTVVRDGEDFLDDGVPHSRCCGAAPACWTRREAACYARAQTSPATKLAGDRELLPGGIATGRQEGRRWSRGTVAQRRLPLLIASGADVHVISRTATRAVEAMDGHYLSVRDTATATSTEPGMRSRPPTTHW